MPPDRFSPDDPREWLNRARSNLVKARETPGLEYEEAVSLATVVLAWAQEIVEAGQDN
jgi:hypothetical protein